MPLHLLVQTAYQSVEPHLRTDGTLHPFGQDWIEGRSHTPRQSTALTQQTTASKGRLRVWRYEPRRETDDRPIASPSYNCTIRLRVTRGHFNERQTNTVPPCPPRRDPALSRRFCPANSRSAAPSTFRRLVATVDGLTLGSSDTGLSSSRSSPLGSTRSSACRSLGAVRPTARRRRGPSPAR